MTLAETPHPEVVSEEEWRAARLKLLEDEKAVTREHDRVNAERRRLPMVKVEKTYLFDGPGGRLSLADLFDGRRQLIIYHFMFDPEWDEGCQGCTSFVNALGTLSMLAERNTSFALVSRAPLEKIEQYKAKRGWSARWFSSYGGDFNYDYRATLETGEQHGLSVFFRVDDDVFHTYSTYARGVEGLTDSYALLDVTPYGRQEDWEDSPAGWPQKPTYG